jgi:hypothetical protein
MSIQVTATAGGDVAIGMALYVRTLTGAKTAPAGASAGNQATIPSQLITPLATGSLVYGAMLGGNIVFTSQSGTTFAYDVNNNGLRYILMRSASATASGTGLTMGANETTNGIGIALLEVEADPMAGRDGVLQRQDRH